MCSVCPSQKMTKKQKLKKRERTTYQTDLTNKKPPELKRLCISSVTNSDWAPPPSISHAAICVHPSKKSAQTNARSTPSGRNLKVSQRFSRQSNWTLPLPCERFSFCVPHLPRPMAIMIAGQPRSTYIPVTISQPSRKSIEHARPTYHSLQRLLIAYMNHSIDRTHNWRIFVIITLWAQTLGPLSLRIHP